MEQMDSLNELALQLGLAANSRNEAHLKQLVAAQINKMITDDFHSLIVLLYRVDISEGRLKKILSDHPGTDAGWLITDLLIERQEQKIRSRRDHQRDHDIPEEDKW